MEHQSSPPVVTEHKNDKKTRPDRPLRNVVVLGSTGNVGVQVVNALSRHPAGFSIRALTRDRSNARFPPNIQVVESDLSTTSLRSSFTGQDAVINCLAIPFIDQQNRIVDIAIECGLARIIPCDWGLDPTQPNAANVLPVTRVKIECLDYIKQFDDEITWSTLITGSFFDWQFQTPGGAFGFDVAKRRVTVFDGGNVEFETTSLPQLGAAVAAVLSPEHREKTANQIVLVNSFTTTQNKVVAALEAVTGTEMMVTHDTTERLRSCGLDAYQKDARDKGALAHLVTASVYGQGRLNLYSKNAVGLWNERLGLEQEDLDESICKALAILDNTDGLSV